VAVVTGGNSGIGLASAKRLAASRSSRRTKAATSPEPSSSSTAALPRS